MLVSVSGYSVIQVIIVVDIVVWIVEPVLFIGLPIVGVVEPGAVVVRPGGATGVEPGAVLFQVIVICLLVQGHCHQQLLLMTGLAGRSCFIFQPNPHHPNQSHRLSQ